MKSRTFALLLWIPCLLLLLSAKQEPQPDTAAPDISREYCQDYDYLVQKLQDNYPYWSLSERQGRHAVEQLSVCREDAVRADSLAAFYSCVERALAPLKDLGHLRLIAPSEYQDSLWPIYASSQDAWGRAVRNPVTARNYQLLCNQEGRFYGTSSPVTRSAAEDSSKMELRLLEQDGLQIGILTVPSFRRDSSAAEQIGSEAEIAAMFAPFYQQCADCDHVIFDIRENAGGSDWVWQYGIVAPNLEGELGCFQIELGRDSSLNRAYLSSIGYMRYGSPVNFLPELGFSPRDVEDMTHYWIFRNVISPSGTNKALSGHLWVLTSPVNYSAAENFVAYCKATGFATLVGERTSGGGGGFPPAFIVLPNTGLIVQYNMLCRINPAGTLNEEAGTTPDLVAPSNQSALETCLHEIKKQYSNVTS